MEQGAQVGKEEVAVTTGTVIACPPGAEYPHQLINTGDKELRYWL